LFPDAAQANRSIFYASQGMPRSAAQVYAMLTAQQNVAVPAGGAGFSTPPASIPAIDLSAHNSDSAGSQPAPPLFQSLFQDKGRGAVSPTVSQLWGAPAPGAEPNPSGTSGQTATPLSLFQFLRPDAHGAGSGV